MYFTFNEGITFFYGKNGQGKTNIVESIYVLSKTSSFRTNHHRELIRYQNDEADLQTVIQLKRRKIQCNIHLTKDGKTCYLNKIKCNRVSEYLGNCNVICFTPDDVTIFKDSPSLRRSLLDRELSSLFPLYMKHLSLFYQYLEERNAFLRQNQSDKEHFLQILNTSLIEASYEIYKGRIWLINKLKDELPTIYTQICGRKDDIRIEFKTYLNILEKEKYQQEGIQILEKNENRDFEKGFTTQGIHRDDFQIYLNDKAIDIYGSQGQQRMIALILKLAMSEIITKVNNDEPILILDDVFSELDEEKQEHLLDYIRKKEQVFITCTKYQKIIKKYDARFHFLEIENGKIVERSTKTNE